MPISVDKCLEHTGNRFMLATIVARRWEQLMSGGRPMVPTRDPRSMQTVFREVEEEKLQLNRETLLIERHGEPVEPLVPLEGEEILMGGVAMEDADEADDEEE